MRQRDYIERLVPAAEVPTDFRVYALHPRFGQAPRYTGYTPDDQEERVYFAQTPIILDTAIRADQARLAPATVPCTHYGDVRKRCRDCRTWFIFFAEEQRHWYEELGFGTESDCVRCFACRKRTQGLARKRHRYEELFHAPHRSEAETIEMAECCLELLEASVFGSHQPGHVRALLNQVARGDERSARFGELLARVEAIEAKATQAIEAKRTPEP